MNPLGLSSEGNSPSTWGTGVKMAIHRLSGKSVRSRGDCLRIMYDRGSKEEIGSVRKVDKYEQ